MSLALDLYKKLYYKSTGINWNMKQILCRNFSLREETFQSWGMRTTVVIPQPEQRWGRSEPQTSKRSPEQEGPGRTTTGTTPTLPEKSSEPWGNHSATAVAAPGYTGANPNPEI
ncbi:hypothetical protein ILYODFUR_015461 [Ilyodon furcidens]|uniref:Uncharacterized protein n=1 Tax=Ilyodon furcidens TaxID=33524 RepID=A0ABV0V405_9TELE